jgi:NAD(P)-dependent dehydrogenase (short-subunit alcohol dehydrogenase family)
MSTSINTVLITGATSGIGLDLARVFHARGSNLVLNGRDPGKLEHTYEALDRPENVALVAGDVADANTGEAMASVARERFGSVDVLINSAGIFAPKPFLDSTEADLDRFYATNLKGTYLTSQAAVREMVKNGGGSIINVGTVLTQHAMTGVPASALLASKGGVHALTTALAAELAPHNIRVNTLAPGIIRTPIHGDADIDSFAGIHPLNRVGEVKDTSDAVLYLATANFVSGIVLEVDGGYTHGR